MSNRFIEDSNKLGNVVNGWVPSNVVFGRNVVKNTLQLITGANVGYILSCNDSTGTAVWVPPGTEGVTSITSNDSSITVSNPTGAVDLKINTAHANNWTGLITTVGSGIVTKSPTDVSGIALSNANQPPNPISNAYSYGDTFLTNGTLPFTINFPTISTGGQQWRFKLQTPITSGITFSFPTNTLSALQTFCMTGSGGYQSGSFTNAGIPTGSNTSQTLDQYIVTNFAGTYYMQNFIARPAGFLNLS